MSAIALMLQGRVMDLDAAPALQATRLSLERKLPMADRLIHSGCSRAQRAILWTQDAGFEGIDGFEFRPKSP